MTTGSDVGARVSKTAVALIEATARVEARHVQRLDGPFGDAATVVKLVTTTSAFTRTASWSRDVHRTIALAVGAGEAVVADCCRETCLLAAMSIEKELRAMEALWPPAMAGVAGAARGVALALVPGLVDAERSQYLELVQLPAMMAVVEDVRTQAGLAKRRHDPDLAAAAVELGRRLTEPGEANLPGRTGRGTVWAASGRVAGDVTHRSVACMNLLREETIRWVNDYAAARGVTP